MSNLFVGIDIGCGGAKACIVDDQGVLLGYGFEEHKITVSNDTWSETDPNEYWNNICHILQSIISSKGIDPKSIKGVSVSSAVPAIVMINKDGQVINKGYNFLDTRAADVVEELKNTIGADRCFEISAFNIEEQSITTSLLWEKRHRPADYRKINKVLTPDGYVTYKLSGEKVVNYSAATFFGPIFNIIEKHFDDKILNELDIDRGLLPELFPCETVIGSVTSEAAQLTGLHVGTPVIAGTVDAFAGWLAGGAIEEGETQINLGTAAVLGVVIGKPNFIKNIWNCIYPVNSKDNYVLFGSTTTGGYIMRYLRNNFSTFEKFIENSSPYDAYDLLNLSANSVSPGAEFLISLPHLMGSRTPEFNRDARGVVFGLGINHEMGHLIRSMMEGVAFSTYRLYSVIKGVGTPTKEPIIMNEGGAKSRLWRKIFTDVFGQETAMLKNRTGAPYGNAILAAVSTGYLDDFSVAKDWAEYVDFMEPDENNHALYMEIFEVYNSVFSHLVEDFGKLASIRKKFNNKG